MMVDSVLKAAIVRNEIAEVLKSDRLNLLGSCEAHVFKLDDGKWIDLTSEPVLVHLIRDNLEGMTKMLAVHMHKLIINNVPVSSNFNVFTPSKKFLQFVCNKFDKSSDNYGFGFGGLSDLEMFMQILSRIKQVAMASLTPSLYNSVSPNMLTNSHFAPSYMSPNLAAPYSFAGSPMKASMYPSDLDANRLYVDEPLSPQLSDGGNSPFSSDKSLDNDKNMPTTPSDCHTISAAEHEYTEFVPNEMSGHSNITSSGQSVSQSHNQGMHTFSTPGRNSALGLGSSELPPYAYNERRICDLINSIDINSTPRKTDEGLQLNNGNMGPIGSPIKRNF